MSRDIPTSMPDEIAQLIETLFGGLTAFASECGLTYNELHTILCRSNQQPLKKLQEWAHYLKTDSDSLAKSLLMSDPDARRAAVEKLAVDAGFDSINHICTTYGVNRQWIFEKIKGKSKQSQISTRLLISTKLGISLDALLDAYETKLAVA